MNGEFDGKVAVITGASTGIGRATALVLAERGATVVLAARESQHLHELEQEISLRGGRAMAVPTDVADFTQVQHLAETAAQSFGHIDVWINNAAQSLYGTVEHTEVEEFRHLMEVNFLGQVHGTKAVLPIMRQQGHGIVIHVSSLEATSPVPLQAAYASTKAAISAFASVARQELRGSGIHVCTVLPAGVDTPLFEHARSKEGFKPTTIAPIYDPFVVARAIASCVRRPRREVLAGSAGRIFLLAGRLVPGLVEAATSRFGARAQLTSIPEGPADDNFQRPRPVADPLRGGLTADAPWSSAEVWARAMLVMLGLAAVAGGVAAMKRSLSRKR